MRLYLLGSFGAPALLPVPPSSLAWMLTAAVMIFAEKTIAGSHCIARRLGVIMVVSEVQTP